MKRLSNRCFFICSWWKRRLFLSKATLAHIPTLKESQSNGKSWHLLESVMDTIHFYKEASSMFEHVCNPLIHPPSSSHPSHNLKETRKIKVVTFFLSLIVELKNERKAGMTFLGKKRRELILGNEGNKVQQFCLIL